MNAARQVVVLHDGLAQKIVAALRTVAVEARLCCHLVNGFVHGLYHSRTERLRHVADAQTYHSHLRV